MVFGFGGFDWFQTMFTIAFLLIASVIVVTLVQSLTQWNRNNHSPKLAVDATVVAKRTDVSVHRRANHDHHASYYHDTSYFVTFQVESGDRMELQMSGQEYGLLLEGDYGKLQFQGSRYLGFTRT